MVTRPRTCCRILASARGTRTRGRDTGQALGCLFFGLALALGCSSADNTKVVVAVWTDLAVPTDMDAVRIDVAGRTKNLSRPFGVGAVGAAQGTKPMAQWDLVPSDVGQTDGVFTVTAVGLLGAAEVVRQSARVYFASGESRLLTLFLGSACKGQTCPDGSTCAAGLCQPLVVGALPPYDPANLRPPDAAAVVGSPDARGLDAAPMDSGVGVDVPMATGGSGGGAGGSGTGGSSGTGGKPGVGGNTGAGGAVVDVGHADSVDAPLTGTGGAAAGGAGGNRDAGVGGVVGTGGSGGGGGTQAGSDAADASAATGGRMGSGGISASGGRVGSGGVSPTGGTPGSGGVIGSGGAGGSSAVCTPACTADQDCVANTCMPWFGQTCSVPTDCPTGSTCCTGADPACAWTRVPTGDGTNTGEFVVATDYQTVTDTITGLTWERATGIAHSNCTGYQTLLCTWAEAKTYCEDLVLGGYSDWRLPSEFELMTIVDYTRQGPSIDPIAFPGILNGTFWTGSPGVASNSDRMVEFQAGQVGDLPATQPSSVRCVR